MEGQTTLARGSLNRKRDYEFQGQKEHQKVLVVGDHMGKDVRSSTKSCLNHWDYDVFLSFRGADTRKNFTDHLYSALVRTGIRTFGDDIELPRGENISKELINAIHRSRISLVIFSKDYASSSWCLDELVQILHCRRTMNHIFIPIFYHVNPSDMRKQTGTFAETFARHEDRFQEDMERVQRWRAAFTEAANCSGLDLQSDANGYEARFIEKIVEQVLYKLNPVRLNVVEHPVGIDFHVEEIKTLLQLGTSNELLIMGIYGMGGIGKTTLAKAVYNHICDEFEGSSCLLNVREASEQSNGLIQLQEQLLFDILKVRILMIGNVDKGISLIKQRLHRKRVLVVLDDVDRLDQIYALARNGECFFGPGSRVIITTRDEHLLVKIGVNYSYKVENMNHSDSLQLFSWHAFNMPHPEEDFREISNAVVDYAGGLPLALEVLGSDLQGRSIIIWKTTLEKFKKSPHAQIQKILGISFESLDHTTREVFLDIACSFMGVNIEYIFKILEECGFSPDIAINILAQRSLVKIDYPYLRMHDLIRDMGREIVRQESRYPGKRSRLWSPEDVLKVLKNHTGSELVEGLSLNPPIHEEDNVISLEFEAFANMKNLRLLQIKGVKNMKLQGCAEHLSKELRWICWHNCPLRFFPPRLLHLENLVVLDMQYSKIKQVWKLENMILNKLKVLNLSFCENLTKSPNFIQVPNLEELILEGCTGLVELHESIGYLKGLVLLNLNGCKSLMNLPESISNLKSLKNFHMGRNFNMRNTADRTTTNLPNRWNPKTFLRASLHVFGFLVKLGLRNSNLLEGDFPIDFGCLSSLQDLDVSVNSFRDLPHSICHLPKLTRLNLSESRSIRSISRLPANLRILLAQNCESLERLSISESRLHALVLRDCYKLVDIQGFENLAFTVALCLEGCLEQEEDSDFVKSLLQLQNWKWQSVIERRQITLYGDEIPNWFSHKSKGTSISFQIPSLSYQEGGILINGLVFGVVCRNENTIHALHGEISVVFHNRTRGRRQVIDRIFYYIIGSQDYLLLLQVGVGGGGKIRPYYQEVIKGEEIEVSFEFECSQALDYVGVKECGVHLPIIQSEEQDQAEGSVMYSDKKMKDNMIDSSSSSTDVRKVIRDRPRNNRWPDPDPVNLIASFVSYVERNSKYASDHI